MKESKKQQAHNRRCGKGKTKSALFFRNLDHHTKTQFKSVCVRREEMMQDVIEAFMRLYIKKPEVVNDELKAIKRDRKPAEVIL